jgi:hypothetical protein
VQGKTNDASGTRNQSLPRQNVDDRPVRDPGAADPTGGTNQIEANATRKESDEWVTS